MVDTIAGTSTKPVRTRPATADRPAPAADLRRLIPPLGLREYWYPALVEKQVKSKPVGLKMLGTDLVFFRGGDDRVKALWNVCPHRGGSLMHGDCHFPGTISCPYHGWTYDGDGNVLAVLPEGPESKIPGTVKARVYPTRTLKGVVFVWMGEREPAPIEEDVPEELFDADTLVMSHAETWDVNWAVALENALDAHPPYLHRNSAIALMNALPLHGAVGRPILTFPRAVALDFAASSLGNRARPSAPPAQYEFPGLGRWPKHRWRRLWSWLFALFRRKWQAPRFHRDPEWTGYSHHLPAMFRMDFQTHMYTRSCVPVDEGSSRQFYFFAARPRNKLTEWYVRAQYNLFHKWSQYNNFSRQDWRVMRPQRYDTPEHLSPTDIEVVGMRKLLLQARGIEGPGKEEEASAAGSPANSRPNARH